jgi:hypothetical protein
MNDLLENISRIHTTEMGKNRIRRNLTLTDDTDVVKYCVDVILRDNCVITRQGKNWYAESDGEIITVNSSSFTIITAKKRNLTM